MWNAVIAALLADNNTPLLSYSMVCMGSRSCMAHTRESAMLDCSGSMICMAAVSTQPGDNSS